MANRPARLARSGFVLPTTVLLVLMVVLTATALTYRSFTRSDMAISQREQQAIANAATPALDRARAKIEFLFNKDNRLSSGLPTGDFLASMMLTEVLPGTGLTPIPGDPFTLPGETRLDINRDGTPDNAWSFVSDNNNEIITYSILVEDEARGNAAINVQSPLSQAKADALVTRTGPLATTEATTGCSNARAEKGWQVVSDGTSSALQKNFQVNVFVPNANNANRTVESFEFQQSRIADRGNKWAAWFRYDLEIFAGRSFNINGAMHADSNLMVRGGPSETNADFTAFMISSHNSCVYGKEASEITVGASREGSTENFQGQIVKGVTTDSAYGGRKATFHTWVSDDEAPIVDDRELKDDNDSVKDKGVKGSVPADVAVNPLVLFTQDRRVPTNASTWTRDAAWDANPIRTEGRIFNKSVDKPFVDDFFRADNRWGPKPRYSDTDATLDLTQNGLTSGANIASANTLLTGDTDGLDGYWERQAVAYGLRLVMGQRLELGNPREWNFNPATNAIGQDRLYPPDAMPTVVTGAMPTVVTKVGANEFRQKRALRDNLAAVQGMVVYHYGLPSGGEFPAACMAMTAHPGTTQSIIESRTFGNWLSGDIRTSFLTGKGTNGWEFGFNPSFATEGGFETAYNLNSSPLKKALSNVAYFAGDLLGGAPSFPPEQDSFVHPYPYLSMGLYHRFGQGVVQSISKR
ncbi:MAG: hypothetical protein DCF17_22255 [Shackletoniella antarctica]|uniref:Uncharacterized protein n=1 Tax=Shackletoniella antarctica TaxID=268115 RepID=A0A2W4VK73_9CYAN|nr:MAG: hypothetical protein DCF17_22255 [Shackletoniella antarctica]